MNDICHCAHARLLVCAFFLTSLFPLAGCAGEVERRWTEEVELDDGKVIEVSRYVKFTKSNSLAADAYSSTDIKSTLEFRGEHSELSLWDAPLIPILLYRDAATYEWTIVATTSNCDVWADRGSPVPPYWEYRLKSNKWVNVPLSPASVGRKTNLFFNYEPNLPAEKISISAKKQVIASNDFGKKYLSVIGDMKRDCMRRL